MIRSLRSRLIALAAISVSVYATPAFAQVIPECPGQLPSTVRLPDLMNIVPHHIHVQEQQKKSRLMFTVGIANIGQGPTELAPAAALNDPTVLVTANQNLYSGPTNQSGPPVCKRSLADAFIFHPEHNHCCETPPKRPTLKTELYSVDGDFL